MQYARFYIVKEIKKKTNWELNVAVHGDCFDTVQPAGGCSAHTTKQEAPTLRHSIYLYLQESLANAR